MGDPIDDDEDDFNVYPGGKTRLSNLFSAQQHPDGTNVNQSLIYVPPKQPKKSDAQQSQNTGENLKLIHATAAFTYKLEDGKYTTQGKLGVAILGDNSKYSYKLLLYKGKQQTISLSTIHPNFKFSVEPNNYAKFPDDKGDQWSITFNTEIELINFTKQITLAKVGSVGKTFSSLIVQDLVMGDGISAELGNCVVISYIGSLYRNFSFGEVFANSEEEGKKVVVELGKSNIPKGWNEGLQGAKKGSKRLIVMPVSFSADFIQLPDMITPHDILIFEISILKVKQLHSSNSKSQTEKKPDVPPRTHSMNNEDIRSRGASLSEQLTQSPRKDNAQLISRIAKIGGTNLLGPNLPTVQTSSESEPEIEIIRPRSRKHSSTSPSPKHTVEKKIETNEIASYSNISTSSSSAAIVYNNAMSPYIANPTSPSDSMTYLHHQPYFSHPSHLIPASMLPPAMPSLMENHLPFLVAQSTEMRVNLNKMNDKIDTAIQKIDDIKLTQNSQHIPNQGSFMDSRVLAQNIERIVQENVQLKSEVESKNAKIHELNEKICDIFQENQRLFKESHSILGQKSEDLLSSSVHFKNQIQALEQEKAKLLSETNEYIDKVKYLQSQLEESQAQITSLQENLNNVATKNMTTDNEIQKKETLVKELQELVEKLTQDKKNLADELKNLKTSLEDAENTNAKLAQDTKQLLDNEALFKDKIKSLQDKLNEALEHKTQFDLLKENTIQLKLKYEARINRLVTELKGKSSASDFSTEIRKSMNKLYKFLQNEIDQNKTYSGKDVLDICLQVIKRTTFTVIGKERAMSEKSDGSSSEKRPSIGDIGSSKVVHSKLSSVNHSNYDIQEKNITEKSNVSGVPKEVLSVSPNQKSEKVVENVQSPKIVESSIENKSEVSISAEGDGLKKDKVINEQSKEENPSVIINEPSKEVGKSPVVIDESPKEDIKPEIDKSSVVIDEPSKEIGKSSVVIDESPKEVKKPEIDKSSIVIDQIRSNTFDHLFISQLHHFGCLKMLKKVVVYFILPCVLLLFLGAIIDEMETFTLSTSTI